MYRDKAFFSLPWDEMNALENAAAFNIMSSGLFQHCNNVHLIKHE